jgi:hypothetical protein
MRAHGHGDDLDLTRSRGHLIVSPIRGRQHCDELAGLEGEDRMVGGDLTLPPARLGNRTIDTQFFSTTESPVRRE